MTELPAGPGPDAPENPPPVAALHPVRRPMTPTRIFLRGLAVSLPTILTIVILIWVAHLIQDNIITPATWLVKYAISQAVDHSVATSTKYDIQAAPPLDYCGSDYRVTKELRDEYQRFLHSDQNAGTRIGDSGAWTLAEQRRSEWMQVRAERTPAQVFVPLGPWAVPYDVYAEVGRSVPPGQIPTSARAVYMEFVAQRYFGSVFHLSALSVVLIIVALYFVGRFVSVQVGGWIVGKFEEQVLGRVPVIRNVYGSVKQVTDFVFSENQQVEYRRVVAVQYPCKGIWSIGFVTGESMLDIAVTAGEPCVAVLVPTSPMPMTGFTVSVPRSELLDLDLSVEQAMQFCISCGVLTPAHQRLAPETFQRLVRTGVLRNTTSRRSNVASSRPKQGPAVGALSGEGEAPQ